MGAQDTWPAALDRLEHDLVRAERLLAAPSSAPAAEAPSADGTGTGASWTPPVVDGPIPPNLRDRARALAGRQQTVLRAMAHAHDAATRQHRLADRLVAVASPDPHPVYVDARA